MLAVNAIATTVSPLALIAADEARAEEGASRFIFTEIEAGIDAHHHVADGEDADILLRWGNPVFADMTSRSAMLSGRQPEEGHAMSRMGLARAEIG